MSAAGVAKIPDENIKRWLLKRRLCAHSWIMTNKEWLANAPRKYAAAKTIHHDASLTRYDIATIKATNPKMAKKV
jgi:hypothetical protein